MGERYLPAQRRARRRDNGFGQMEDRVMKTAAQFFGKDLLSFAGVEESFARAAPTEHIHLEMRKMEEDFNFIMEDGSWRHLEFESDSITERDLRRFREYEAYIGLTYNVPVATTVLCTSDVKVLKKELVNGNNVYRVELVRLKDKKAEKAFNKVERKIRRGKALKNSDLFPILLSPLMSGKMDISERICRGMDILQMKELDMATDEIKKMQSVLYALAIKFLKREELEKVKERIGMTVLGQMLWTDGLEKGLEKGESCFAALTEVLLKASRTDDLLKAANDRAYRDELYREYGIDKK